MPLIMSAYLPGKLPELELPPSAFKVLCAMINVQDPGGAVGETQRRIALRLNLPESAVSRGMRELREKGLVFKRPGSQRKRLHPVIAGYATQDALEKALASFEGDPDVPDITVPDYEVRPPRNTGRARLSAVS